MNVRHRSVACALALLGACTAVPARAQTAIWQKRADTTIVMGGLYLPAIGWWGGSSAVLDAGVVLWGGDPIGGLDPPHSLWRWTDDSWQPTCTTPPCSGLLPGDWLDSGLLFDSRRSRLVLFGGHNAEKGSETDETWEFDGTGWQKLCTATPCTTQKPAARLGHSMAYDAANEAALLFGGRSGYSGNSDCTQAQLYAETWTWNGSVWMAWQPAAHPGPRWHASMVYDSRRKRVVLFGGHECLLQTSAWRVSSQTWEWDGQGWEPRIVEGPPGRQGAVMAYDSRRGRVVLASGEGQAALLVDLWDWDGTLWRSIPVSGEQPSPRQSARAAFDEQRGRIVMYGGYTDHPVGDTWELHIVGEPCSSGSTCDTLFCANSVCCETECSGLCERCDGANPGFCTPVVGVETDGCKGTRMCSSSGVCASHFGQPCEQGADCLSQNCVGNTCCAAADCGGFRCSSDGTCKTSCTADQDCLAGFACDSSGLCAGKNATCDGDHTLQLTSGGTQDCHPYRCAPTGTCRETCSSEGDCVASHWCNSAARCVPQSAWSAGRTLVSCSLAAGQQTGPERTWLLMTAIGLSWLLCARRRDRSHPARSGSQHKARLARPGRRRSSW